MTKSKNKKKPHTLPKWRQAQQYLFKQIKEKKLKPGDELPSDKVIANALDFSIQPVIRAMNDLALKGVIARSSGAPTRLKSALPEINDQQLSFIHSSRSQHGTLPETRVIEMACRVPQKSSAHEMKAIKELGLTARQSFYALTRVRSFDGIPRVIHRAYLNPEHFGEDFFARHNFECESLIEIYNQAGYEILSRETVLTARYATEQEQAIFKIEKQPVLASEQTLIALAPATGESFVLEYLAATYLDWEYRIDNRIPETGEDQ